MKISAKINTMQNINILLFVRLLYLTNWRNALLWYGPMSDRTSLTLQLTSAESVSRHVSRANGGHLNTCCEQTLANNLHFSCVFGSRGFCPLCQIFTVLMLDGR